jgi:hypothetical protein
VGPIIAGLFVTMWDVWGATFRDDLSIPETESAGT